MLRAKLKSPFQGTLESLAEKHDLNLLEVTLCLPEQNRSKISGDQFVDLMGQISTWGELLLIVVTPDGVFECKGEIPSGKVGAGYYNVGHGSSIAGHLRHEHCSDILFVRRSFHGKETCSIQFFNHDGQAMFKIFLGRTVEGALKPEQLGKFEDLSGLTRSPI